MTTEPRPLHTPGPWRENDGTIFAANGYWIAVVAIGDDWKANAALIARAPELLARVAELEALHNGSELLRNAQSELLSEVGNELEALASDNARLRELLRRAKRFCDESKDIESIAMSSEIRKELG